MLFGTLTTRLLEATTVGERSILSLAERDVTIRNHHKHKEGRKLAYFSELSWGLRLESGSCSLGFSLLLKFSWVWRRLVLVLVISPGLLLICQDARDTQPAAVYVPGWNSIPNIPSLPIDSNKAVCCSAGGRFPGRFTIEI